MQNTLKKLTFSFLSIFGGILYLSIILLQNYLTPFLKLLLSGAAIIIVVFLVFHGIKKIVKGDELNRNLFFKSSAITLMILYILIFTAQIIWFNISESSHAVLLYFVYFFLLMIIPIHYIIYIALKNKFE